MTCETSALAADLVPHWETRSAQMHKYLGGPGSMRRYTNQHLTSAEILAELVAFAREVSGENRRGQKFDP